MVYALAFWPVFQLVHSTAAVLGLLPVTLAAFLLGAWPGVAAAVGCLVVASGWYLALGFELGMTLPRSGPAHLMYALVGLVVAWARGAMLALREERARLERSRALLITAERVAKMGSWEVDLASGASVWSDGAFHNIGVAPGSERPGFELAIKHVHPDDRDRVRAMMRKGYELRRPFDFEHRVLRDDGSVGTLTGRVEFVDSPDGPRAYGIALDVTSQRELEARVTVADRMASLGTLAGGMAHEINNPLAVVAANIDYVAGELARVEDGKLPDAAGAASALAEARDGTRRIAKIVGDLRTFARGDEEKLAPVDVNRIADAALGLARSELRQRATVVPAYGEVPLVIADDARLGQVLVNLLVNAAQAIPPGDTARNRITVTTRLRDGRVEIDVSDTGAGIAPDVRGRMFDPFFTTKPPGVGMGLGLAICHGIVRRLGGDLAVVDSVVGQGTTMRVSLPPAPRVLPDEPPRVVAPPPPPPRKVAPPAARRRARVLVVDDEELLLQAIRRSLGGAHDVDTAGSGKRALELLSTNRYDVILCDLLMPEVSGMDLHAELRARAPELADRMVFMTGGAFTARANEFLDSVPNLRLDKPVSTTALAQLFAERAGADGS